MPFDVLSYCLPCVVKVEMNPVLTDSTFYRKSAVVVGKISRKREKRLEEGMIGHVLLESFLVKNYTMMNISRMVKKKNVFLL